MMFNGFNEKWYSHMLYGCVGDNEKYLMYTFQNLSANKENKKTTTSFANKKKRKKISCESLPITKRN